MKPRKNPPSHTPPPPERFLDNIRLPLAWYTAETWQVMKATALDPEKFEATFAEWEAMANRTFAGLLMRGMHAEKCYIDPEGFRGWCLVTGRKNDAAGRAQYVANPPKDTGG